jgi:hypothetical protein
VAADGNGDGQFHDGLLMDLRREDLSPTDSAAAQPSSATTS